jgi:hypothetical protein
LHMLIWHFMAAAWKCEDFHLNVGNKGTGCCIMRKHCLTLHFSPEIFLLGITWLIPPPSLLSWLHHQQLFVSHHFDTKVIEVHSQVVPNTLTEHNFQDTLKKSQKC